MARCRRNCRAVREGSGCCAPFAQSRRDRRLRLACPPRLWSRLTVKVRATESVGRNPVPICPSRPRTRGRVGALATCVTTLAPGARFVTHVPANGPVARANRSRQPGATGGVDPTPVTVGVPTLGDGSKSRATRRTKGARHGWHRHSPSLTACRSYPAARPGPISPRRRRRPGPRRSGGSARAGPRASACCARPSRSGRRRSSRRAPRARARRRRRCPSRSGRRC
jgi:hypothetical protein